MHPEPAPADRERDEDPAAGIPEPVEDESVAWEPVVTRPDPMSEEDQQALLDVVTDDGEPWWLREGDPDPDDPPPPEDYNLRGIAAECRQVSAQVFPGEYPSRAAQFASGMLMDTMPGRPELAAFADEAAGADDSFGGASDDEVLGVLCAWDRVEAHAAARKHAAVADASAVARLPARRWGAGPDAGGVGRVHRERAVRVPVGRGHHARPGARPGGQAPRHQGGVPGRHREPGESGDHRPRGRGPGPRRPSRWPPCSAWPTGPARSPASGPSTPTWPVTWRAPPPATRQPPGA